MSQSFSAINALNDAKSESDRVSLPDFNLDDDDDDIQLESVSVAERERSNTSRGVASEDDVEGEEDDLAGANDGIRRVLVAVEIPTFQRKGEYRSIREENEVAKVLKYVQDRQQVKYRVRFRDGHSEIIPFSLLVDLTGGPEAVERFEQGIESEDPDSESEDELATMVETRTVRKRQRRPAEFVDTATAVSPESEEDADTRDYYRRSGRKPKGRAQRLRLTFSRSQSRDVSEGDSEDEEEEEDISDGDFGSRRPKRARRVITRSSRGGASSRPSHSRATRSAKPSTYQMLAYENHNVEEYDESESESDNMNILQSDVLPPTKKRKRKPKTTLTSITVDDMLFERAPKKANRRSERATRTQNNMEEADINDIYRSDSDRGPTAPKAVGAREVFKELPRSNLFRQRHCQQCETCGQGTNVGMLIFCQGCTLAYHKNCVGRRNGREHLVTKIGDDDFVLQCRRCIALAKKKEFTAPDHGMCQTCRQKGDSCTPFRPNKTMLQEQRDREANGGVDPITYVDEALINGEDNVLFRCLTCFRGWHMQHLPPRNPQYAMDADKDEWELANIRFNEYSYDWKCKDCHDMPGKVQGLVAWRPRDLDAYGPGFAIDMVEEDEKEYLIKWENHSYFRASWMPGAWTWGVTAYAMRKAFARRDDAQLPKMRSEDAIPEEYLRIDILLDVKYTSYVEIRTEEIDKARVKEVDTALIKYKGLGYEDSAWEKVPRPDDGDRWTDFVTAYNDWVAGRYVHVPKAGPLRNRLEKVRAQEFTALEKSKQPDYIVGGELMQYQIDGLNWLYFKWYSKMNAILADEMGLGKTIQVISFLATLAKEHTCFPFLVVVPNSTCANWRREIKQWAPSLRVVTYFGSSQARQMAHRYEMFPEGSKDLRCHVVVTSYDAAADDSARRVLKSVPWAALVVDEGQRLKSDKNLLYAALSDLKIPFRLLLTGTPLQNNARELFNLIQFLDDKFDAAALEMEYAELTSENIPRLHDLIRPFILRRTKAEVLGFLPPMAQIIVPVSMSVVQKKLYMSILAKNPDLMRAIFANNRSLKQAERANLNNILMQLRKCLCHPFVYSREIEEKSDNAIVSHRNLVEASAKLQLLEIMLPKLKERGHRVLIFSQFLDMLDIVEDFLDGLELRYQRLDGSLGSLQKQKRIDEFNAPDSQLFAFLLSTRAGGVGINLATADTVIILDPDFNPHQDIQALSRAHRIGQKNKVLCFQLMTRASAEEKIMQIGRKKMALDHVLIEQMDADDAADLDVESILRHGASELFNDDGEQEIKYDHASIDKLLDRSQIESTKTDADHSAESQFSFARVWANNQATLQEDLPDIGGDGPDPSVWERILKEREKIAAAEAAARETALGRGRRARAAIDYAATEMDRDADGEGDGPDGAQNAAPSPAKPSKRRKNADDSSDTDFQAEDKSDAEDSNYGQDERVDPNELKDSTERRKSINGIAAPPAPPPIKEIKRANVVFHPPTAYVAARTTFSHMPSKAPSFPTCPACKRQHPPGSCPLKLAGTEKCPMCGIAHFGGNRICPHFQSETQVREMLAALKQSPESREHIELAKKYLTGVKGNIVHKKKRDAEKAAAMAAAAQGMPVNGQPHGGAPGMRPQFQNPMANGGHALHGATSNGGAMQPPVRNAASDINDFSALSAVAEWNKAANGPGMLMSSSRAPAGYSVAPIGK